MAKGLNRRLVTFQTLLKDFSFSFMRLALKDSNVLSSSEIQSLVKRFTAAFTTPQINGSCMNTS